jgi:RNA-directed DNA polymerase
MDGANMPHRSPLSVRQGDPVCATLNLVVPRAHEATDMRIADTAGSVRVRSGAVTPLIGESLRPGDVDSTNGRSTRPTPTMPGIRISTTATRTTTTRRSKVAPGPSADKNDAGLAPFAFEELVSAYFDCRKSKRNTPSALDFEQNLERNLISLNDDLLSGAYKPGRSICFVVTRPKAREVWAAAFRDRVVHHLLYNRIAPRFYASFIADSCACIPGRGTMYAAERLEAKIRSASQNWSRPTFYLKCDLANFFVAIDKSVLHNQIAARVTERWWLALAETILFHDPRQNFELRGTPELVARVPAHKQLHNQPAHLGLPIGNLSSQFFANIYLDVLDQFVKHQVRARHYIRYVDDFILLHDSPQWLNDAHDAISEFVQTRLHAKLNPTKTILQPVSRGVDFVGQVIKPHCRTTRRRTFNEAISRVDGIDAGDVYTTANSYFGLLRQAGASHVDRTQLANAVRRRATPSTSNLLRPIEQERTSMLKNATIYRLQTPWAMTAEQLAALLAPQVFAPCSSLELQSIGWVPPRDNGLLVHVVAGQWLLKLQTETKILPASVINEVTKARAAEITEQQGFAPGRKQMRELREDVTDELLPRAFSRTGAMHVWIDPANGWLVCDAATPARAEAALKLFIKAIDKFPLETLRTVMSPTAAMTSWLLNDEAPSNFTVDQDTELRSTGEGKATVRYIRHTLEADAMRTNIEAGKQCTRLAMTWADKISFVLTEGLVIKRIAALDILKEDTSGSTKNDEERFDGDFMLMTGELNKMLAEIVGALGGEIKEQL